VPLFEYSCKRCEIVFEELSSASEATACPKCGTTETERVLFSRVAVGKTSAPAPSPCGRCGDPRGPGACSTS
jgi:putative FmdB family regulatory protein